MKLANGAPTATFFIQPLLPRLRTPDKPTAQTTMPPSSKDLPQNFVRRFASAKISAAAQPPHPRPANPVSVNDEVTGTVTHIKPYGAFVDLGDSQSGLVHISEISDSFVSSVAAFLSVGDSVNVRVLKVDPSYRKISLTIRQSISVRSKGYQRVIELGGDWGHPWNDDGQANFIDLGPLPPRRPHHWEPDLSLFNRFDDGQEQAKPHADQPDN